MSLIPDASRRELSVLAGATLVTLMEDYSTEFGDFAALALISCAAQTCALPLGVPEIPERAVKHLSHRCVNRGDLEPDENRGGRADRNDAAAPGRRSRS